MVFGCLKSYCVRESVVVAYEKGVFVRVYAGGGGGESIR